MQNDDACPPNARRLNGWKEIATYVGKGVRTVQRWEKVFLLPVHRMGIGNGEIVYAVVSELEQWQAKVETNRPNGTIAQSECVHDGQPSSHPAGVPPPAAEARSGKSPLLAGVLAVLAITIVFAAAVRWNAVPLFFGSAHIAEPDHWAIEDGALQIYSGDGASLWQHQFVPRLEQGECGDPTYLRSTRSVVIEDLDGDGHREVLIARKTPADARLYCLDYDGKVRFTKAVSETFLFGQGPEPPPHPITGVFTTNDGPSEKAVWMTTSHYKDFASVLIKLDPRGGAHSEYVSDGWITALQTLTLPGGHRIVLVGAINNENRGASLAVLDAAHPTGSAPALNPEYRCFNCPSGGPEAFFVFPRLVVGRELGFSCPVVDIRLWGSRFLVNVGQANMDMPMDPMPVRGSAWYTFDTRLRLVSAELQPDYQNVKVRLQRLGRIPPNLPAEGDKDLLPVLLWTGDRFVPIPSPTK